MQMDVLAVFTLLDWGVVAAYFALVTVVGFWVARRNAGDEYFLANRSLPTWAVAVSLVATMLSASTFVSVPDTGFSGNLSYLILNIGGFLAVFAVAFLFIPRLYRAGTVTIYGFIAQRFGEPGRVAVSCAFIVGRLLASGARLFVASIPLCYLLFGTVEKPPFHQFAIAIGLIGVIGTIYTAKGGVRAVVWVDTIQFAIVLGTAFLTIGILLHRIPLSVSDIVHFLQHSPDAAHPNKLAILDTSLDPAKSYTLWTAFAVVFLNAAAFGTDQDLAQRFLISKSPVKGGISIIASQFIGIAVVALFLLIGLLLFTYYKAPHAAVPPYGLPTEGIAVYPWFLFHELPTGIAGIAVAGFFAIAQGSLDSAMNAVASSIVADLYLPWKRRRNPDQPLPETKASKLTVAGVGALMCAFALLCAIMYDPKQRTLLDFVLGMMNFALSGMLAIFLAALFTKRGNSATVIAALIVGAVIVFLFQDKVTPLWTPAVFGHNQPIAWPWWMPIATPVAFLVCIAGKPPANVPVVQPLYVGETSTPG